MNRETATVEKPTASPTLCVVFVHYRTPEFLEQALEALRQHPPGCSHEIVVIDNGPAEDGAEEICRAHPSCVYHRPGKNLGYAKGVNLGISKSAAPYILILNPDIVVRDGSIDTLLGVMEGDPRVGIVGPKLLYPDGALQLSARRFYDMRTLILRRTFIGKLFPNHRLLREHLMTDWDHSGQRDVDWLIGASLLVRREMVEDVGGMDERFFLYFEDVDWCYRAHQHGWKVLYVPEAVMTHHYRRDSARKPLGPGMRRHLESVLRYYEKWSLLLYILKQKAPQIRTAAMLLMDISMVTLAFLAAYLLRAAMGDFLTKPLFSLGNYVRFILFGDLVAILGIAGFGLYRQKAWFDRFHSWWQLLRAIATVSLVMMASTFLLAAHTYSRVMVLLYFPLALLFVGLGREALRRLVRRVKDRGLQLKRFLAVGSQEKLDDLRARVASHNVPGIEIVYLTVDSLGRHPSGQALDAADDLVRWVQRERIREVMIFEDAAARHIAQGALERLSRSGVPLDLVPEGQALMRPGSSILGLWGFSMIPLGGVSRVRVASPAKRVADLAVSLPALLLGFPLHVLQMILIKERPRLVSEERIGARGRPLSWTRYAASTALTRALRCMEHYPRLTQVVRGRASLVGIHPIPRQIWETLPESVRVDAPDAPAGLTGPGGRDPAGTDEAADLLTRNRSYVRRWSIEEDFRILFQGRRPEGGARSEGPDG